MNTEIRPAVIAEWERCTAELVKIRTEELAFCNVQGRMLEMGILTRERYDAEYDAGVAQYNRQRNLVGARRDGIEVGMTEAESRFIDEKSREEIGDWLAANGYGHIVEMYRVSRRPVAE